MKKSVGKPKMNKQTLVMIIVAIAVLLYIFMPRMEMLKTDQYSTHLRRKLNFRGGKTGEFHYDLYDAGKACSNNSECDGIYRHIPQNRYVLMRKYSSSDTNANNSPNEYYDSYLKKN